jgi:monothiol glutaredoxin
MVREQFFKAVRKLDDRGQQNSSTNDFPLEYKFALRFWMWHYLAMNKPKIVAYLKPTCGWSQGVRAVLRKYDLPFEDRDIINDPIQRQEMIEKSGQMMSPCVEINGQMLPDISGEEVEAWMLANNIVSPNDRTPDAPINQPCAHEMPPSSPLNFAARR